VAEEGGTGTNGGTGEGRERRVGEAVGAALTWLEGVDAGDAERTWEEGGRRFQDGVTPGSWAASLARVQGLLGRPRSRELTHGELRTELPGLPDGSWATLTYATRFGKKRSGTESVTLEEEDDGVWRVVGYFVK
jgi:hypothetical protein